MINDPMNKDFEKNFSRLSSFVIKAWVFSAVVGIISAIAGLALVGAIIYFLVKVAAAL